MPGLLKAILGEQDLCPCGTCVPNIPLRSLLVNMLSMITFVPGKCFPRKNPHFIHISAQMLSPIEALCIQITSPSFSLYPHLLCLSSQHSPLPPQYRMSLSFTVCLWEENGGPSRVGALLSAAPQALTQCLVMVGAQHGLAN